MKRIAIILVVALSSELAVADNFILVTSSKNPVAAVSKADLKEMCLGKKKQWDKGSIVQLLLQDEDSAALNWLASTIFDTSPKTLITKMRQEVFKGELQKPVRCASDAECADQAKALGGALTFVSAQMKLPDGTKAVALTP